MTSHHKPFIGALLLLLPSVVGNTAWQGGTAPPYLVSLQYYGAVCDGSTDDTTAIQAAFTDAVAHDYWIAWPAATCAAASALTLGRSNGSAYAHVHIVGESEDTSKLLYTGSSTSVTFLTLEHEAYFAIENMNIVNGSST